MQPHTSFQSEETVPSDDGNNSAAGSYGSRVPCPSCRETFARAEHLARHMRKHTGERPYACSLCGKQFARSDSMKRHELLHSTSTKRKKQDASEPNEGISTTMTVVTRCNDDSQIGLHTSEQSDSIIVAENPPWGANNRNARADHHIDDMDPMGLTNAQDINFDIQDQTDATNTNFGFISDFNWLPVLEYKDHISNPFGSLWDNSSFGTTTSRLENALGLSPLRARTQSAVASPLGSSVSQSVNFNDQVQSPVTTSSVASGSVGEVSNVSNVDEAVKETLGETYVEGRVTRLPRGKKRKMSLRDSSQQTINPDDGILSYSFSNDEIGVQLPMNARYLNGQSFEEMKAAFFRTCTRQQSVFEPFATEKFPSPSTVDNLIHHCVEYFLPTLPFIHRASIKQQPSTWILYLALAAVGARYVSDISEMEVECLDEFLRRSLTLIESSSPVPCLDHVQAKVLACILFTYGSTSRRESVGRSLMGELIEYALHGWSMQIEKANLSTTSGWIAKESSIRVASTIWLLDKTMAYQLSYKPLLCNSDATFPLPGYDKFWDEATIQPAEIQERVGPKIPSLKDAIEILYIKKTVYPNIGELGRILLVHALLDQTSSVAERCRSRLSFWEPCAKGAENIVKDPTGSEVWLPGMAYYARWRNAACDCLDVLHWHANSVIGLSAGREHPTVLFLHLSRVILLCPIDQLREMVYMLSGITSPDKARIELISRQLVRWALDDCFKARLAIIHAGVLLYHVRRHSLNSFYEPCAIFLAILCLWAYASAHSGSPPASIPDTAITALNDLGEDNDFTPPLIHLDRPCDDEIVQLFITKGNIIVPNVTGVGNICHPDGPSKLLNVGCSILRFARNWDLRNRYVAVLMQLQMRMARSST